MFKGVVAGTGDCILTSTLSSVLICAPTKSCIRVKKLLADRGVLGVELPSFELVGLLGSSDLTAIDAYLEQGAEWLVFTSSQSVDELAQGVARLGEASELLFWKKLQSKSVAVVGRATALACEQVGLKVALISSESSAQSLAREIADVLGGQEVQAAEQGVSYRQTARVIVFRAEQPAFDLSGYLRANGISVADVVCYRRGDLAISESLLSSITEALMAQKILSVISLSGESVRGLLNVFRPNEESAAILKSTPLFVIGPKTAEVARELGFKEIVVSRDRSITGVVDTLVSYLRR